MALRFIDGFDHYSVSQMARKWGAGLPVSKQPGRLGGECVRFTFGTYTPALKSLDNQPSWVMGFAFRANVATGGPFLIARVTDAGNLQAELYLNVDGTLSVKRSGTNVTGGTSTVGVTFGNWNYIEWKITIADSIPANSCQVRIDGAVVLTVATGQDLKTTTNATANGIGLSPTANIGSSTFDYDDAYICDSSGARNNDFLGDVSVETLYPNGAGTFAGWTPSAGANWQCVSEAPANDDTDYVSTTVVGTKDAYAFGNLASTPTSIKGVQISALARKTDAAVRTLALVNKSGATEIATLGIALSGSYAYASAVQESDPATAAAWTGAGVNAAEWGVKLDS